MDQQHFPAEDELIHHSDKSMLKVSVSYIQNGAGFHIIQMRVTSPCSIFVALTGIDLPAEGCTTFVADDVTRKGITL